MLINKKIEESINKQINRELYSAYLYLGMAAYFESIGLLGFTSWLQVQAKEEVGHAMKFQNYIFERGGRVIFDSLEAPPKEWKSPLVAFENVYEHEKKVTEMINELVKCAKLENDYATESMLKWFVDEQVEEEANALMIYEKIEMVEENKIGLYMLDKELMQRGK